VGASLDVVVFPVLGRDLADQSQRGDLGHQAAATESDHGMFAAGHQLVGEGPGVPE